MALPFASAGYGPALRIVAPPHWRALIRIKD